MDALRRIIGADHPFQPGCARAGVIRRQPQFLAELAVMRAIVHHRGQIGDHAVVLWLISGIDRIEKEQRKRRAVEISAVFLPCGDPVKQPADRRQIGKAHRLFDRQAAQRNGVVAGFGDFLVLLPQANAGIERRIVGVAGTLIEKGRHYAQRRIRGPGCADMRGNALGAVDALFVESAGLGVMIDPAAVGFVIDAGVQRQLVGHQRQIDRAALGKIGTAVFGAGGVGGQRQAECIRIGRRGDIADRTAFGTVAIERALRPAQHFDTFDIGQANFDRTVAIEIGHGDRYIIKIEPDGRGARHRTDPANDDVGAPFLAGDRVERDTRHCARQIVITGDLLILERSAGQHRQADWHGADIFAALLRGDDDFAPGAITGRGRRRSIGGGRGLGQGETGA